MEDKKNYLRNIKTALIIAIITMLIPIGGSAYSLATEKHKDSTPTATVSGELITATVDDNLVKDKPKEEEKTTEEAESTEATEQTATEEQEATVEEESTQSSSTSYSEPVYSGPTVLPVEAHCENGFDKLDTLQALVDNAGYGQLVYGGNYEGIATYFIHNYKGGIDMLSRIGVGENVVLDGSTMTCVGNVIRYDIETFLDIAVLARNYGGTTAIQTCYGSGNLYVILK